MLQEALVRNDIPCINKEKHGGILKLVGIMSFEEFDIFVPIGSYEKAKEILAELFDSAKFRLTKSTKQFKQGKKIKTNKPYKKVTIR